MPSTLPRLPSAARRVVISVNPKAGARSARDRVDRLAELLRQRGFDVEIFTNLDQVADRANRWHKRGVLRALVGVGGDGTAAELVNRTVEGLPLSLLPAGNENLLARYLQLGKTPQQVCQTVADGALLRLDAARANRRIFLLMIGCGFDADVVRRLHARRSGHVRSLSYLKPMLESIRSYEYPQLHAYCDQQETSPADLLVARWLFAFNLPCYGGGLRLAPRADATDGMLDVCAFGRGSLWHALRYAAAVFGQRHQRLADCTMRRVCRLRITAEAEVPYQLDGDPGGVLPVDVEVVPRRLTLVVPVSQAERFGS